MRFILKNFDEEKRRNNEDVLLRTEGNTTKTATPRRKAITTKTNCSENERATRKRDFFFDFRVNFICNADKSDYFDNLDLNLKIKVV